MQTRLFDRLAERVSFARRGWSLEWLSRRTSTRMCRWLTSIGVLTVPDPCRGVLGCTGDYPFTVYRGLNLNLLASLLSLPDLHCGPRSTSYSGSSSSSNAITASTSGLSLSPVAHLVSVPLDSCSVGLLRACRGNSASSLPKLDGLEWSRDSPLFYGHD
jgi:hypothetical protein